MDGEAWGVWRKLLLLKGQVVELPGHCEGFFQSLRTHRVVGDVDEAKLAAGSNDPSSDGLLLVDWGARSPCGEINYWNAIGFLVLRCHLYCSWRAEMLAN